MNLKLSSCLCFAVAFGVMATPPARGQSSGVGEVGHGQYGDRQNGAFGDVDQGHFGDAGAGQFTANNFPRNQEGRVNAVNGVPRRGSTAAAPASQSPYVTLPAPADAAPPK